MASVNTWNQKQLPLLMNTTSIPTPLCVPPLLPRKLKGESIPFQPSPLLGSKFNMIQDLQSQNHQMLKSEYGMNQNSFSVSHHLPGSRSRVIQGFHPPANQLFVNGTQNSNLLEHQLPSRTNCVIRALHPPADQMLVNQSKETTYLQQNQLLSGTNCAIRGLLPPANQIIVNQSKETTYLQQHQQSSKCAQVIQNFYSVTHQLLPNESNISQQASSLNGQLLSSAVNPNFSLFNRQLPAGISQFKRPPSLSEFTRNQEKYQSDHQQSERESTMRRSLDRLSTPDNQCIPIQQSIGNQGSYPLTANIPISKIGFNLNQEPSMSDMNLPQNLQPQYSEKVHICVIGPPGCGKADLIRTFASNDNIQIPPEKRLSIFCEEELIDYGTTFKIAIWYADDITSTADDLRSLCQSSKSAIVLVYSLAQESTLLTVLKWIKVLKSDIAVNVPILLVANTTGTDSESTSREFSEIMPNGVGFSDGARAKEEHDLAGYYKFSTRCVKDAVTIFFMAALNAFSRTVGKSGIKSMVLAQ